MYGKIFDSIYDGTLRANWKALITFQQFIILAGPDGVIDMTPHAIHGRTGIPLDIIEDGIKHLAEPDPYSRSATEEGRRIVLLDDSRPWGWKLVNHLYYQKLITRDDKRKADRDRIAVKRLEKSVVSQSVANGSVPSQFVEIVADVAHADSDATTDSNKTTTLGLAPNGAQVRQNKNGRDLKSEAKEVLSFLNNKTGKNFEFVNARGNLTASMKIIIDRLKDGASVQDCKTVIANRHGKWAGKRSDKYDKDMFEYMRPSTIFRASKFEEYKAGCILPEQEKRRTDV